MRLVKTAEKQPQVPEPLIPTDVPEYPFQSVVTDLFELDGHYYLAYADRLTSFPELAHFPSAPSSSHLISIIREFFQRWGVAEEISLDGGPNLVSTEMTSWLQKWGVKIRQSSAYYPQSNGRAEAAVKSLKRLLKGNTGRKGTINTDEVASALLQYRNTPLRGIDQSPAELALGRPLRDTVPLPRSRYRISPHWHQQLKNREKVMSERNAETKKKYDRHTRNLPQLQVGDRVRCQNVRSKKWDRTGTVLEVHDHRQYIVKMDGSGRMSLRNRRHLTKIVEYAPEIPCNINTTPAADDQQQHPQQQQQQQQQPQQQPQQQQQRQQQFPHPPSSPPAARNDDTTSTVKQNLAQPTNKTTHYVRRSTRPTKKTTFYHEEFNA